MHISVATVQLLSCYSLLPSFGVNDPDAACRCWCAGTAGAVGPVCIAVAVAVFVAVAVAVVVFVAVAVAAVVGVVVPRKQE